MIAPRPHFAAADFTYSRAAAAAKCHDLLLDEACFEKQRQIDSLQRGIKVLTRSRRGCTFAAALWHKADGRMVHAAEIVTVFIEPGKGSVEIPADFWAAVEKMEGRSIPVAERAS